MNLNLRYSRPTCFARVNEEKEYTLVLSRSMSINGTTNKQLHTFVGYIVHMYARAYGYMIEELRHLTFETLHAAVFHKF